MAAILRVKRRCDEEPHEALLLSCKKRKKDNETPFRTLLTFAGTLESQDDDVAAHISKKLRKPDFKESMKHVTNISQKIRDECKKVSQKNRFKVVNLYRAISDTGGAEDSTEANNDAAKDEKQAITVVDIEKEPAQDDISVNNLPEDISSSENAGKGYVYDLYYTSTVDFDDNLMDVHLSVHPMESELIYDRDPEDDTQYADDDSDSNDENNWRNDYPDSDNSVTEEDMMLAVQMDDLNLDNELSSDDGEEDYVYSKDADPKDIIRYGTRYAQYKAKVVKELEETDSDETNDFY